MSSLGANRPDAPAPASARRGAGSRRLLLEAKPDVANEVRPDLAVQRFEKFHPPEIVQF